MIGTRRRKRFCWGTIEQLEDRRLLSATPHSDLVESYNPISYWRLSELSGVTAVDETGLSSGAYEPGVTLGAPGVVSGDSAAEFDGSGDVVEAPHDDAYLLGEGSLSLWFTLQSVSGRSGIFSKDSSGYDTGGHFSMLVENGTLRVRNQSTSASREVQGSSLTANNWHHAVVTWGSPGFHLYLDGTLSASDQTWTNGLAGNYEPVVIGGLQWLSGNLVANRIDYPLNGKVDEVAIFGQALDAGQVQSLYGSTTGGPQNNPPTAANDTATTNEDTP
ncbi:LamG-like jellyroll fold domain-containing protein, partial [Planctomycetota bacterium]